MSASRINPTLISKAAEVIKAAMAEGNQEAYSLAFSLDCAQLLQSPETAVELERLRARVAELEAERHATNEALSDAAEQLRVQRDRIAELEALKPASIQTCGVCGAGYTYGQPCSTCTFHALMDEAQKKQRQQEDPDAPGPYGDPIAYGPTGVRCGCGKDAHSNLVPCRPNSPEDPHDSELHHDYAYGRDLPEVTP